MSLQGLNNMLFSNQKNCILCDSISTEDFCEPCTAHLPWLSQQHCPVCLWPTPDGQICGPCLQKPPAYTRTVAALSYAFPVDALIQALKYQANLAMAPILVRLIIKKLHNTPYKPDILIPMPLHPARLCERGFNQAMELGRVISGQMNIPILANGCQRIQNTPPQAGLPWKARRSNIRNAFECTIALSGKHVAVVDDVMTTGTTLNELAIILRRQGATEVSNWIVARTLPETSLLDPSH